MNEFKTNLNETPNNETENRKPTYRCGICGKKHESIPERNKCEAACLKEKARIDAALKQKKLEAEKEKRRKEIEEKIGETRKLINSFLRDYGCLSLEDKCLFDDDIPNLSKILGWWF